MTTDCLIFLLVFQRKPPGRKIRAIRQWEKKAFQTSIGLPGIVALPTHAIPFQ
jgi:hypothetical protein